MYIPNNTLFDIYNTWSTDQNYIKKCNNDNKINEHAKYFNLTFGKYFWIFQTLLFKKYSSLMELRNFNNLKQTENTKKKV